MCLISGNNKIWYSVKKKTKYITLCLGNSAEKCNNFFFIIIFKRTMGLRITVYDSRKKAR